MKPVWCCVCRQWFDSDEAIALHYKGPLDKFDRPPRTEQGGRCGIEVNPDPDTRAGEMWVCNPCAKVIAEARK